MRVNAPRKQHAHFFRPGDPPEARGFRVRADDRRGLLSRAGGSESLLERYLLAAELLKEGGTERSVMSGFGSLFSSSDLFCAPLYVLIESSLMEAASSSGLGVSSITGALDDDAVDGVEMLTLEASCCAGVSACGSVGMSRGRDVGDGSSARNVSAASGLAGDVVGSASGSSSWAASFEVAAGARGGKSSEVPAWDALGARGGNSEAASE